MIYKIDYLAYNVTAPLHIYHHYYSYNSSYYDQYYYTDYYYEYNGNYYKARVFRLAKQHFSNSEKVIYFNKELDRVNNVTNLVLTYVTFPLVGIIILLNIINIRYIISLERSRKRNIINKKSALF